MKLLLVLVFIGYSIVFSAEQQSSCFKYVAMQTYVSKIAYKSTSYSCGWWSWRRCYRSKSYKYATISYMQKKMCCPGYSSDGSSSICLPVCEPPCTGNNTTCSSPNTCSCVEGWIGSTCNIEISASSCGSNPCEEGCTQANGTQTCYCFGGKKLANDNNACLGGVVNVTAVAEARLANLTWYPPVNHSSSDGAIPLTGYNISCLNTIQAFVLSTSFTVPSLNPFTSYDCCIKPYWSGNGIGPSVCKPITTLEDAPSDSPRNISVIADDSESILIEWMPPLIPNGILIYYDIYINYTNGSDIDTRKTTDGSTTLYLLEHLNIYQLVGISLSATTDGGEGPQTPYVYNRSGEALTAAVPSYLAINIISNCSASITWHLTTFLEEELSTNNYYILIRNLTEDNKDTFMHTWVLNSSSSSYEIEGLEPYVPYEVSIVNASNTSIVTDGAVRVYTEVFFILESVPSTAPVWTLINRESISTIRLEWTPLTLEESKGFITNYTVKFSEVDDSTLCAKAIQNVTALEFITTNSTLIVLTDLNLRSQYYVSIAASTVAGLGVYSQWKLVEVAVNQLFVFFIDKIPLSCEEWIQQNQAIKLTDFSNALIGIMNDCCHNCSLIPSNFIYKTPSFREYCIDNRLAIIETTLFTYETLLQSIHSWVERSPNVTMNGTVVTIQFFCTSSSNCSYFTDYHSITVRLLPSFTLSLLPSLGGFESMQVAVNSVDTAFQYITPVIITGVIIVMILLAVGIAVSCVFVLVSKKKKSRYVLKENHTLNNSAGSKKNEPRIDLTNPCYDSLPLSTVRQHQQGTTTPSNRNYNLPGHECEETSYDAVGTTEANYSLIDHEDQNMTLTCISNIYYEGTSVPLNGTTSADDVNNSNTHPVAEYSYINNESGINIEVPPSPLILGNNTTANTIHQGQQEHGNKTHCDGDESEYSHLNHTGWDRIDLATQNITAEDYLDSCSVVQHINANEAMASKQAEKPATQHADKSDASCVYSLVNEVDSELT